MKLKITLATATAMGLLMGSAWATDNNKVYIDQSGDGNSASIVQSGSDNEAGLATDAMLQQDKLNVIDILQSGDNNDVGTSGTGVLQRGPSATAASHNVIDIEQSSDGNTVGEVTQNAKGNVQKGANTLTVLQSGTGGNSIAVVKQVQESGKTGQIADIQQTGGNNVLSLVDQYTKTEVNSVKNRIDVLMSGDSNGGGVLAGVAAGVGATASQLVQSTGVFNPGGNGNTIDLEIAGNGNQFGIRQGGTLNSVGTLTLNGDGNSLGIFQDGSSNMVSLGVVDGDLNEIGLKQVGTNIVGVNIFGADSDNNSVLVDQNGTNTADVDLGTVGGGSDNDFTVVQTGTNTATVELEAGNSNHLNLSQSGGSGGANVASIFISGSFNNNAGIFGGAADGAAGALTPGDVFQDGSLNTIDIEVGQDLVPSNSNLMAFNQVGTGNEISGTIDGSNNQVAVVQNGGSNLANFTQLGGGNNLGVSQ